MAVPQTNGWDDYHTGVVKLGAAGDHTVTVRAELDDPAHWKPMNLAAVTLTRTGD